MRPLLALAVCQLAGCLVQNPAYDEASAGSTGPGSTSNDDPATATTDPTTTTATGGSGTGAGSTGPDVDTTAGAASTSGTTGCAPQQLYVDADGDGWGAGDPVPGCPGEPGLADQAGDCDDGLIDVNPGAVELCDPDQRDEDCDGLVNEHSPTNQSCDGCTLAEFGGHSYWFCSAPAGWEAARAACSGFGTAAVAVDLPIVDGPEENAFLFAHQQTLQASEMWLGGRDVDPLPNKYTWYDGSELVYQNWVVSDFDNGCIIMRIDQGGKWSDRGCASTYAFACESTQ